MGGVAVQRSHCNDCVDCNNHLSILSQDLSVSENLNLPCDKDDRVSSGSCGGLVYFYGYQKGQIVICNLASKEMKVLPPPYFEPPPPLISTIYLKTVGLGYDAKSGDYKVLRFCVENHEEVDEDGEERLAAINDHLDLYSFKSGSWKKIKKPHTRFYSNTGVYVAETGCCYWPASYLLTDDEEDELDNTTGTSSSPDHPRRHVLLFDFATESFGQFPLPLTTIGGNAVYKLVEYSGSLGALSFSYYSSSYPDDDDDDDKLSTIQLFVWKETSWDVLHVVSLVGVARPLCLKDDRLLFVEAKPRGERGQLMVYDLDTKRLKKLDIYDYRGRMDVISYVETTDPDPRPRLPDSIPMTTMISPENKKKKKKMKKKKKKLNRDKKRSMY